MIRHALIAIVLWALLGIPVMCALDGAHHECTACQVVSCSHEATCPDDPCVDILVIDGGPLATSMTPIPPMALALPDAPMSGSRCPVIGDPPVNLPRPKSDLPLLS